MTSSLTQTSDELQGLFWTLKCPADIAEMLQVTHRNLNYWIYRTPEQRRYTTFQIPKKSGKPRTIDAPNTNVKILQQKLNQVLQSVYRTKPSVHGFVADKSVKTNALQHVQRRWVFNIDLENFFPSINFGRVRGMFMGKPYNLPQDVATVLAHLCCFQGHLPQGAPTSPVISNMICAQMDSQLQQLAKITRSTYTRYADDITFSTTHRRFPAEIATLDILNQIHLGASLKQTIEQNGFSINGDKIRLSGRYRRQEVTGVTVKRIPQLATEIHKSDTAMLYAWKQHGLGAAQATWEREYSHKHRAPGQTPPQFEKVLKGRLST